MKKLLIITGVLFFSLMVGAHDSHKKSKKPDPNATHFGAQLEKAELTPLPVVLADYDKFKGKTITFEATTKKVCKKSGCWMVLQDGDQQVRTLFKDYGFFVPANILGKKVRVQGVMESKKVSAATIRHLMKDEGKKMAEIQKVKTGEMRFQFTATGVELVL